MVTPNTLDIFRTDERLIEEQIPGSFNQPLLPITPTGYRDRLDIFAIRVYGSRAPIVLRTIMWANGDFEMDDWASILPENLNINTPPIIPLKYTKEQELILG